MERTTKAPVEATPAFVRDAGYAWRWMRWDVPLRIAPMASLPVIWAFGWGGGVEAVGLTVPYRAAAWIWLALLAAAVLAASALFVMWVLKWAAVPTAGSLVLEVPFFLVLNPFAEEVLFRGLVQGRLGEFIGQPAAVAVVGIVFGFHHALAGFRVSFLLWATLGGFLFGAVAVHYSSVAPAMLLHSAADAGIFIVGPWLRARIKLKPQAARLAGSG